MSDDPGRLAALEAERRRLAARLDETVIASLNLLLAQANAYEQTLNAGPEMRMALGVLNSLIRQAMQQAHDLQASLDPSLLEDLGLPAALAHIAAQQTRASGITITIHNTPLDHHLPPLIALALFRAAQDVLYQACQAGAVRAALRLTMDDDNRLRLSITDDGHYVAGRTLLASNQQHITQLGGSIAFDADSTRISFVLAPPVDLTPREMQVIICLTQGQTNREIAAQLDLSPRTVNFHLDNIYTKLGVNSRTEAAVYALRQGWTLSE